MRRLSQSTARPKSSSWSILLRAIRLFRPYRARALVLVVAVAGAAVLDLLPALIIQRIIDDAIPNQSIGELNVLFAVLAGSVLAGGFLGVGIGYVNHTIGQGVMHRMRAGLHSHLQQLGVRFYTQTRTGEILSRVSTDVNAVQQALTGTFTDFLTNVLTLGVALAFMFALSWKLALVAVAILPLFAWPTMRMGMIQRRLMQQWHEENARMTAHLEETLSVSGAMLVKTFGRQGHESQRFGGSNDRLRDLAIRRMMAARWFNMGTGLFGALAPGAVYWYGGRGVIDNSISLGTVVAFAVLTQRVFAPFTAIARINTTMLSSLALFERIFEYQDLAAEITEKPDARSLDRPKGRLTFDNVTFAYNKRSTPALSGVSFDAPPGTMVALVGPSGAGKTSLTYLLQRFYDPDEGAVRLDGHDLRDLTLESVSNAVGAVLQETFLFHASLLDNIRYGRLDATDDEVEAAAQVAGLRPLVAGLPEGLRTLVGERGYRLSGGEKQRVALARAVLKDPPVLVLDEATASLDSRLEREIREATAKLAATRTTVVIAHRLSTVLKADLILVLDGGRIVERGTHEELLGHEGLYAQLYREQFAGESTEPPAPTRSPAASGMS